VARGGCHERRHSAAAPANGGAENGWREKAAADATRRGLCSRPCPAEVGPLWVGPNLGRNLKCAKATGKKGARYDDDEEGSNLAVCDSGVIRYRVRQSIGHKDSFVGLSVRKVDISATRWSV
jgi:hypothetical protein